MQNVQPWETLTNKIKDIFKMHKAEVDNKSVVSIRNQLWLGCEGRRCVHFWINTLHHSSQKSGTITARGNTNIVSEGQWASNRLISRHPEVSQHLQDSHKLSTCLETVTPPTFKKLVITQIKATCLIAPSSVTGAQWVPSTKCTQLGFLWKNGLNP